MRQLRTVLIIAANVAILLILVEGGARLIWSKVDPEVNCMVLVEDDRLYSLAPSCSYEAKHWEQPEIIVYETDACGRRSIDRCEDPAINDTALRIATIGDSFTYGSMLPIELQFGSLIKETLEEEQNQSVTVANFGVEGYDLLQLAGVLDQLDPVDHQIVVYGLTPNDLFNPQSRGIAENRRAQDPLKAIRAQSRAAKASLVDRLRSAVRRLRAVQVAAHFAFQNDALYLATYQSRGDKAGFIGDQLTGYWRERLAEFDDFLARATAQGFDNLIILYIPQRVQHVLNKQPESADRARLLGAEIQRIVEARGVLFIDGLAALEGLGSDPYFVIDGHLNPEGARALGRHAGAVIRQNLKRYSP